jgi:hypothetical protein
MPIDSNLPPVVPPVTAASPAKRESKEEREAKTQVAMEGLAAESTANAEAPASEELSIEPKHPALDPGTYQRKPGSSRSLQRTPKSGGDQIDVSR